MVIQLNIQKVIHALINLKCALSQMISKFTLILPFSMCMHHKQNKIEYTQNNTFLGAGKIDHLKSLRINHFQSDRKVIVFFSSCSKMMYIFVGIMSFIWQFTMRGLSNRMSRYNGYLLNVVKPCTQPLCELAQFSWIMETLNCSVMSRCLADRATEKRYEFCNERTNKQRLVE